MITLFSVMMIYPIETTSANFKYSEFNWDEFAKANKTYWDSYCLNSNDENCEDKILKSQKKFYVKLYKLLAKYENKGLFINDNIILETVFIDMTPSSFADDGKEYMDDWESPSGVYVIDNEEVTDADIEDNYDDAEAAEEYYSEERDTLKLLIKNMIAYSTACYGVYGNPTEHVAEDESVTYTCDNGGVLTNIYTSSSSYETKCVDKLSSYENGFWEYFVSKWAHDPKLLHNKVLPFLKNNPIDSKYNDCVSITSGYPEKGQYVYNDDKHVSTDRYFDFLSYNIYFDKKAHLQKRFEESVLKPAGVKCMTDDVCSDSLESAGKYEEYEAQIIEVRREIIDDIIFILNNYGITINYNNSNESSFNQAIEYESSRNSYYWPIGSDETEERNGIIYADGEPASTDIVSYYGPRKNPITGEDEEHYGIDISGVDGETNVVATYQGEVITIVDNCTVGDYECNGGYGNMIILSHSNGDYTVYAKLASIDSSVTVGATVMKGQLIGKVGMTGNTDKAILHYELREGGNDISYTKDPMEIVSSSNPRPAAAAGDFSVHETSLTKEEFVSKLRSYCNNSGASCSRDFINVFVGHAEEVYDVSISSNVNPELVVVRGAVEGMSPGGSSNNYWGIRCYNGQGVSACSRYSSLADGIRGFAGVVKNYQNASDMMKKYAYIGAYWFNPGSWSLGGCIYFPYIREYMSDARANQVDAVCGGPQCSNGGGGSCTATTDEDQTAYATWQVARKMSPLRYNIFGV